MTEFLIHSHRCFVQEQLVEATLHIKNNTIYKVHDGLYTLDNIPFLEYDSAIVMPGIIDTHVHINEPGRSDWEGFDTATKAAAAGGITTLIEMPLNASPVTTSKEAFLQKQKAATNKLHVNCGFYGGVVPDNSASIEELITSGVFGIKGFLTHSGIDEFPNVTRKHLESIAPILQKYDIPLLLHCELDDDKIPVVTDTKSYQEYLNSRPAHWETNAIELALELQQEYDIRVHIVHLSTAEGLPLIRKHKEKTDKLTVETCPHYLFFDAEMIPDASPIYKCAPPIREKSNNEVLWNAVLEGDFDFISSDHSPAPPEIKQLESGDFFKAWGGISGLQFTLPVLFTSGRNYGLTLEQLIPLLTSKPANFIGLAHKKGFLKDGYEADITIWDENQHISIEENNIFHKHKPTPYLGQKLLGKTIDTFVNGKRVLNNGKLENLNCGSLLKKEIE